MKVACKIDYGQFEYNKIYDYSYSYKNNMKIYYVTGPYSSNEFTKKQFDVIFTPYVYKKHNINFNC